jgi:thioredoxin-like negative regulator of GroEL
MDLNIKTEQIDASVALVAHRLYKEGQYREAIPVLQDILDMEPLNWQCRLFLAACYFKTAQPMAAERALRFVYEKCPDESLKQKACFAMQAVNAATAKKIFVPLEFGALEERIPSPLLSIDAIIS